MNTRRLTVPLINLVVFLGAGIALYKLANSRAILPQSNATEENLQGMTAVAVDVTTISRQTLTRTITAYGRVEPAPAGKDHSAGAAGVGAPFAGIIGEMNCTEGQHVQAGQTLFTMDNRNVEADIQRAQAVVSASRTFVDTAKSISGMPTWLWPIAQWEADSAQAALDRAITERKLLTVTAPISGIVAMVRMGSGEAAIAGTVVVELVDPDHVVLALDVPGFLAGDVKPGQAVLIEPQSIESKVIIVDPIVDPATGLASVDASIGSNLASKPGQFIRAKIVVEQRENCLVVPAESVVRDSEGHSQIAVVSDDEHRATLRRVDLGLIQGDRVEVRADWLEPGMTVVTTGASALLYRTDIRIVGR
jgi:membrane fusion protein (multidrug efflux system)